jgi:two-component system, response regulator PdtaR
VQTDIAAPLPELRLSQWQRAMFAPDENAGSQTEADKPDQVLVIEDDVLIANQIDAALSDAGFEIIGIAASGDEALEIVKSRLPTLAVIDVRLAGDRDGVDTAIELFHAHGVRCIFASAYSDSEARRRAEPAAPLGWLQKPYTITSLTAMVRAAAKELHSKGR